MTKHELRAKYKKLRSQLPAEEVDARSLAIANNVLTLPIWDSENFHIFLPIKKQNEVDTEYLLSVLQGKDKNVIVSRSDFATLEMTHFLLTDNTKIIINAYGIPEPEGGISIQPEQLDVVFVPLLCFDQQGNRLGYGKGFYDRFLSQCRPDCMKIGLSLFLEETQGITADPHDVVLNCCVTADKVFYF